MPIEVFVFSLIHTIFVKITIISLFFIHKRVTPSLEQIKLLYDKSHWTKMSIGKLYYDLVDKSLYFEAFQSASVFFKKKRE